MDTSSDPIGLGEDDRIFSGSAWNFARQPAEQKKYSIPLCSALKRAVVGFTSIPQTGSIALAGSCAALVWAIEWSMFQLPKVYLESEVPVTAPGLRSAWTGQSPSPHMHLG